MKLLILLALFIFPATLTAGKLKLCGVHWPPFSIASKGKFVSGVTIDVYKEAFRRMKMDYTVQLLPWPRCKLFVLRGRYDAIMDNPKQRKLFLQSKYPTGIYPVAVYTRADFPSNRFRPSMLRGKSVGVVNGYVPPKIFETIRGVTLDYGKTELQVLRKLKRKRYDFVVLDIFSAPIHGRNINLKIKRLMPLVFVKKLHLSFNRKKGRVARRFAATLKAMVRDGSMDRIYRKYGLRPYSELLQIKAASHE